MIQRGSPWYKFKDRIIEANQNLSFTQAFGWTPKQIKELDKEDKLIYLAQLKGLSLAEPKE